MLGGSDGYQQRHSAIIAAHFLQSVKSKMENKRQIQLPCDQIAHVPRHQFHSLLVRVTLTLADGQQYGPSSSREECEQRWGHGFKVTALLYGQQGTTCGFLLAIESEAANSGGMARIGRTIEFAGIHDMLSCFLYGGHSRLTVARLPESRECPGEVSQTLLDQSWECQQIMRLAAVRGLSPEPLQVVGSSQTSENSVPFGPGCQLSQC